MKILLPITHPMHERNWIGSGAKDVLKAAGHKVLVADDPSYRSYRRVRRFLRLGSMVARAGRGSTTYRHKLTLPRPLLDRIAIACWRRSVGDPERIAARIEAKLPIPRDDMIVIDTFRPDVVLWPTMIHDDPADDLVKGAKSRGIPVIAAPASWDTLTTKGGFLVRPDRLFVWGASSARHAEQDHGFAQRAISITGPPHWDHYFEPRPACPRTKILIAGTSVAYWRDEQEVVGWLTEDFPGRVLYRPHPRRGGEWSLKACLELRDQLDETAVVVAAFSTVIVEAALQGIPSCVVAFGRGLPPLAEYEHMAEVLKWPGVRLCDSLRRLQECVADDLLQLGEIIGLRVSASEVADADGHCRERVAKAIDSRSSLR